MHFSEDVQRIPNEKSSSIIGPRNAHGVGHGQSEAAQPSDNNHVRQLIPGESSPNLLTAASNAGFSGDGVFVGSHDLAPTVSAVPDTSLEPNNRLLSGGLITDNPGIYSGGWPSYLNGSADRDVCPMTTNPDLRANNPVERLPSRAVFIKEFFSSPNGKM